MSLTLGSSIKVAKHTMAFEPPTTTPPKRHRQNGLLFQELCFGFSPISCGGTRATMVGKGVDHCSTKQIVGFFVTDQTNHAIKPAFNGVF